VFGGRAKRTMRIAHDDVFLKFQLIVLNIGNQQRADLLDGLHVKAVYAFC
jgi:hypothetical protein